MPIWYFFFSSIHFSFSFCNLFNFQNRVFFFLCSGDQNMMLTSHSNSDEIELFQLNWVPSQFLSNFLSRHQIIKQATTTTATPLYGYWTQILRPKLITGNKLELLRVLFLENGFGAAGQPIGSSGSCGGSRIVVKMFCRSKIPKCHSIVREAHQ